MAGRIDTEGLREKAQRLEARERRLDRASTDFYNSSVIVNSIALVFACASLVIITVGLGSAVGASSVAVVSLTAGIGSQLISLVLGTLARMVRRQVATLKGQVEADEQGNRCLGEPPAQGEQVSEVSTELGDHPAASAEVTTGLVFGSEVPDLSKTEGLGFETGQKPGSDGPGRNQGCGPRA